MSLENVTFSSSGGSWKPVSIEVEAGLDQAARTFEATLAAWPMPIAAAVAALKGAPPCTISAGGLLLTGYAEKLEPRLEGQGGTLVVSGRSKSCDLIDCSHEHPTGFFRDKDVTAICQALDTAGVGVVAEDKGEVRKRFKANAGESVFAVANRLCRAEELTVSDNENGQMVILKPKGQAHSGGLIEGVNILDGSGATHDFSARFSKVKVKGQKPEGSGAEALEIEAEVEDGGIKRNRVKILVPAEELDKAKAKARAKRFRDRAAGRSISAEIIALGWRDGGGQLWKPGWTVMVESPFLGLAQSMLIERVRFSQSSEGTQATLSLVDPKTYGGKGGKGGASSGAWDVGKIGGEDV